MSSRTCSSPPTTPPIGLIGALATFGVAYVARPVGGLVMGHFGDKLGRKKILLLTLGIMGLASLGIGFLPTYEQVGVWAPILLVAGRLAQGFSAGAESAGASTLTLEHSPEGKRAFFTSFVMMGYASGMVLATLVFIPVAALPQEAMMAWGWRIPFWLSIVVLAVAYWVRTHLDETPVFEDAQDKDQVTPMPVKEVLKFQAPDVFRVVGMSIQVVMQTIFTVFGLAYATSTAGFDRSSILTVNAVAIGLSMLVIPFAAKLADRIGRRPAAADRGTGLRRHDLPVLPGAVVREYCACLPGSVPEHDRAVLLLQRQSGAHSSPSSSPRRCATPAWLWATSSDWFWQVSRR